MTMKTIGLALLISTLVSYGQNSFQQREPQKRDTDYAITTKDGNSQVWEKTEYEPSADGKQIPHVHRYTELATGLNYLKDGQWTASKEEIQVLPDGGAAAVQGQHQVYFPGDIYQGQIELITPDGKHVKSRPMGLSYDDGQNTVLIAELKDSVGYLVSSNQIVYPDAFTDFKADLRYTYTKAGFEQDIILREQPPIPATFNMDPDETHLQLLTEFFDAEPTKQRTEDTDTQLSFGQMTMVRGKAFSTDNTSAKGIPVSKSWAKLSGRDFLIEELPVSSMAEELEALPVSPQLSKVNSPIRNKLSATRLLPPVRLAQVTTNTIQLAKADFNQQKGFVLDYQTINANKTNFTFQGDTTYYLSGSLSLGGTNTFEGGTVIKYASGVQLGIAYWVYNHNAYIDCRASAYRPIVMTAKDDNTVGETISGSTGSPSGYYAGYALNLDEVAGTISNFRISYAQNGIMAAYSSVINLRDGQIINCQNGVACDGESGKFRNLLFANVQNAIYNVTSANIDVQNTTFCNSSYLISQAVDGTLNFVNCIFVGINSLTNYYSYYPSSLTGTNNGFYRDYYPPPSFGVGQIVETSAYPFQTVGGGSYYLTNGCVFRDVGTTNIDPILLAELQQKTTYPPIVYSNVTIATATTFSPQVQRDTDTPDLGYHYDPIDYCFGGVHVATNITFTAGTVMGWFELPGNGGPGYGIALPNYASATFNGTVTSPCVEARYETVQEGGNGNWKDKGWLGGIIGAGADSSIAASSIINASFTHFALTASGPNDVRDYYAGLIFQPTDCEFYSGGVGGYLISMNVTNCLFDRTYIAQDSGNAGNEVSVVNVTFHGGTIYMTTTYPLPVNFKNCVLDGTVVDCTGYGANATYSTYDYNAYTNASDPFPVGGTHDIHVSNFNWQSSWLGNYYLPTSSTLIDAGSTTADQVGLYHFTTQTNQDKETTSTVDIGYHYVATDTYGNPVDTDTDGIPDYLEDKNGNGAVNSGETDWQDYYSIDLGLKVWITRPKNGTVFP